MSLPSGLKHPRRSALLIPLAFAILLVAGIAIFALAHLAAKGPAPQLGATHEQVATEQTPPTRDAYDLKDFSEPNAK